MADTADLEEVFEDEEPTRATAEESPGQEDKKTNQRDLLGDGSLLLATHEQGWGTEKPRDLAKVRASWKITFERNGEVIFTPPAGGFEFLLDEGKVMVAIEIGLKELTAGAKATLRVGESWGHGPLSPIPGGATLRGAAIIVELHLKEVTNEMLPGHHETVAQALEFVTEKKEQGNRCFAAKDPLDDGRALRRYQVGMDVLEQLLSEEKWAANFGKSSSSSSPAKKKTLVGKPQAPLAEQLEDLESIKSLLLALRLNAAQTEIRRSKYQHAIELCSLVLKYQDPKSSKAHFRRGYAKAELGDYPGAIEDLKMAAAAAPADVGIRKELQRIEALHKEYLAKEKSSFTGLFDKLKQEDKELEKREEERKKQEEEEARKQKEEEERLAKEEVHKKMQKEKEKAEQDAKVKEKEEKAKAAEAQKAGPQAPAAADPPKETAIAPIKQTVGSWSPMSAQDELDAKTQEIVKQLQEEGKAKGRNLQVLPTVQEPPAPVDYEVPSFLRSKKKKPKQSPSTRV